MPIPTAPTSTRWRTLWQATDYYEHYGIEYIEIDEIWAGVTANDGNPRRAELKPVRLKSWNNRVTYHERLKSSYYELQKHWRVQDED